MSDQLRNGQTFRCPRCKSRTVITDSRGNKKRRAVRRTHMCVRNNKHRFSTWEVEATRFEAQDKLEQLQKALALILKAAKP